MAVELRASSAHHRLDPLDRVICGVLAEMGLWSAKRIAPAFGINESTVRKHQQRHGKRMSQPAVAPDDFSVPTSDCRVGL